MFILESEFMHYIIYMYIFYCYVSVYVQSLDEAPGDYFLSTVFPTKKIELADNSKTLKDFGIKNNDQLMVQGT